MSVRKPIQVPEELKDTMDVMQGEFRAKTSYEVIERLISYYREGEKQKKIDFERKQMEKQQQQATMIHLGEGVKTNYMRFSNDLGFGNESSAVQFLLEHYENSRSIDMQTFKRFRELR